MEEFSCTTRIISGAGAMQALGQMGIRRLLLVADPFFVKNGVADKAARLSGAEEVTVFSNITPDPSVELAAEGTAVVKQAQPDAIVALGGGSCMDCAKAMAYFSGKDIPLIAIPTTSGSGSEVTDFAILTHKQVKHPLVDKKLLPKAAILDSDLLEQMPAGLVADSGFDVLCHAAEAYVAKNAGAITDALAGAAFASVFAALPASFAGNKAVRLQVHQGATMAGMAFTQAGLGLCHALAHSIGGVFHIPHGRLNAILLPAVVECNSHAAMGKYAKLARCAGLGASSDTMAVRNLKNGLLRLRKELQLPQTLAQAGIPPAQVRQHAKAITQAALSDPCCATNPIQVEDFMVRRILDEVTGRV